MMPAFPDRAVGIPGACTPTLPDTVAVDPVLPSAPTVIAPPAPTQPTPAGPPPVEVTITTDTFIVDAGGERFICQDFANPFGGISVDVIESEHTMADGSHHMFAFQKEGLTSGPLGECGGLEYDRFIHSSQRLRELQGHPAHVRALCGDERNVHLQRRLLSCA